MKQILKLTIALSMGVVALNFQSCGSSNKEKKNPSEDSVTVDTDAIVDENGNIIFLDGDASDEYVGAIEIVEADPIDESLERLANAMADYLKAADAGNDMLKKTYAEDVSKEVKFLNEHQDKMTDSQKQLYAKLNAIEL